MKERYLEVTFRRGKPLAAYLHLPRNAAAKSGRSEQAAVGMVVDYAATGEAIGVEITAPAQVTVRDVNAVLAKLGLSPLSPEELAPLEPSLRTR
jgi:hypothetical protein